MAPSKYLFITILLICAFPLQAAGQALAKQNDISILIGEWVRLEMADMFSKLVRSNSAKISCLQ